MCEPSTIGTRRLKHLVGAALLVLLSLQRAHADPVGETHRVTTEKTAVLRNAERRDQLRVTIWYPATKDSVEQPLVIGPPEKPLFEVGSVAFDAAFSNSGLRPILLLSHGAGGSAYLMGWFGIAMARAGYVVIAVDHPGDNFTDERTTAAMLLAWDRAEDLRSALAAAENDPVIGPHLDRARVGVAGLSFGAIGATASGTWPWPEATSGTFLYVQNLPRFRISPWNILVVPDPSRSDEQLNRDIKYIVGAAVPFFVLLRIKSISNGLHFRRETAGRFKMFSTEVGGVVN